MFVVVADVGRKEAFEVASIHDQDPVETFAAHGADPSFDERVRAGCPYWCADRPDAFGRRLQSELPPGLPEKPGILRQEATTSLRRSRVNAPLFRNFIVEALIGDSKT